LQRGDVISGRGRFLRRVQTGGSYLPRASYTLNLVIVAGPSDKYRVHRAVVFLQHVPEGKATIAPSSELEETLGRLLAVGRSAWPELSSTDEAFLRHLASVVTANAHPIGALQGLDAGGLFLTCCCLAGDERALATLDARFLAPIAGRLTRTGATPQFAAEVVQELRTRLLVSRSGAAPRISSYGGRGGLASWVRISAARVAVDLVRAQKPDSLRRDDRVEVRSSPADPELAFVKQHYRVEFERAFRATLATLTPRDANVLRLHYIENVSAQSIGAIYGVTARSVQMWIATSRRRILRETRRLMAERFSLTSSQLDGLLGLVQSQLDISFRNLLDKPDPQPG